MNAIIFDLFGTLVYIDQPTHPYRDLIAQASHPDARKLVMTTDSTPLRLAKQLGVELPVEPANAVDDRILAEVERIKLYPDVIPALTRLKAEGYVLIVSSNLAKPYGRARVLLDELVDYWNFSFDTGILKPDPNMFLSPASAYGVAPENCLVIGDSVGSDGGGAAAAGMPFMLIDRHGRHPSHRAITDLTELFSSGALPL